MTSELYQQYSREIDNNLTQDFDENETLKDSIDTALQNGGPLKNFLTPKPNDHNHDFNALFSRLDNSLYTLIRTGDNKKKKYYLYAIEKASHIYNKENQADSAEAIAAHYAYEARLGNAPPGASAAVASAQHAKRQTNPHDTISGPVRARQLKNDPFTGKPNKTTNTFEAPVEYRDHKGMTTSRGDGAAPPPPPVIYPPLSEGGKSSRRHRRGRTLHKRRKSSKVRKMRHRHTHTRSRR